MSSEIDNSSSASPVTSPVSQRPASKLQLSSLARIVKAQVSLLASNLTKENYSKIAPDIQSVCCIAISLKCILLIILPISSSIHTEKISDSILYAFYSWISVDNMIQATAMTMMNPRHFYCSKPMLATPLTFQVQKLSLRLLKHWPASIDPMQS